MSRGPGRWQRAVLDATSSERGMWLGVEEVAAFDLSVAVVRHRQRSTLTESEREGIRRAIRTLTAAGRVESTRAWDEGGYLCVRSVPPDDDEITEACKAWATRLAEQP